MATKFLLPVSTPAVVGGLDEYDVGTGLLDDGGHDSHLVVGGLVEDGVLL